MEESRQIIGNGISSPVNFKVFYAWSYLLAEGKN
jgi:hypothetical protein